MSEHMLSSERRSKRRLTIAGTFFAGAAAVGAIFVGAQAYAEKEHRKAPEMVITGDFLDDGEHVSTVSAVNVKCNMPLSGEPHVRVESRTVTERNGRWGRMIVSNFSPDVSTCEEAVQIVRSNPEEIYIRIKDNVTGYNPEIVGDGTPALGDTFYDVVRDARDSNVVEHIFHS